MGLYNFFYQYLFYSISDIDDFKKINDTYGHDCGDYVLKTIGDLLAAKDVLCCRWGGEDIDNVLKDTDDKLYQGKQSGKNKLIN